MVRDADATASQAPEAIAIEPRSVEAGLEMVEEAEVYRVESEIGAGGMGQVLAARGSRLGRAVAVKVIATDRDDLRRRFEREARVTARLQHPGIVPVYGKGRGPDGRPFYAMKHVTGRPLDKLIAEAETVAQRLALLPNVLAVAEAIAYAHSQQVIHRDLKPANVLVGSFGETVVIDWGLAKDVGVEDEPGAVTASPFRVSGDETAHGKVMGTPAYMSPEQARGEPVDQRTDVYALGAILYHVLSGAPPHAKAGEGSVPWDSMLARVIATEPPPLAERQPGLPPDLLAIVARAMARRPADRFESAATLADDLRRYQTGQLVGAHRYSTRELLRRWLRRHRTAVTVGAASVLVLIVVGVLSIRRIIAEQERAEAARELAEQQRDQAEALASFMVFDLKDRLASVGRLDMMKTVVERTRQHYEAQPSPRTDKEFIARAGVMVNLGDILASSGDSTGALIQYRAAASLMEALRVISPEPRAVSNLAAVRRLIGNMLSQQHDFAGAILEYARALEAARQVVAVKPDVLAEQSALSDLMQSYARALENVGDYDGAIREAREALAVMERVRAKDPREPGFIDQERQARQTLGDVSIARDPAGARDRYLEALELAKELARVAPNGTATQVMLAQSYARVGEAFSKLGDQARALAPFQEQLDIVAKLAAHDPSNMDWQKSLYGAHARNGDILRSLGKTTEAMAKYRETEAIVQRLVKLDSKNIAYLTDAIVNQENIGQAFRALGDHANALARFREALALTERMIALDPKTAQWTYFRSVINENLADTHEALGDMAAGLAAHERSKADRVALVARDPSNLEWRRTLVYSNLAIANNHRKRGDNAAALGVARAAAVESRDLVKRLPGNAMLEGELTRNPWQVAKIEIGLAQHAAALETLAEARAIAQRLADRDPSAPHREVLYNLMMVQGEALAATGKRQQAIAEYEAALPLCEVLAGELVAREDIAADLPIIRAALARLRR